MRGDELLIASFLATLRASQPSASYFHTSVTKESFILQIASFLATVPAAFMRAEVQVSLFTENRQEGCRF